jgi:NodT family efflux transporter outer membrane factor (OMF) lipoprotein
LKPLHHLASLFAILGLGSLATGCAMAPSPTPGEALAASSLPPAWNAPLPHGGSPARLAQWWQGLGDPVLLELIEAAQGVSPTLASATSRLSQSRAALTTAAAANRPSLNASLSAQRGVSSVSPAVGTALQSSLDASWEIDLFGANRASANAAAARLQGTAALWHEARVSVAADTANLYFSWRSCRQILAVLQSDTTSRLETARLSALSAQAGFTAPAVSALAQASAAEGRAHSAQQASQCDSALIALVALTAIAEPALRQRLQDSSTGSSSLNPNTRAMPMVASLPAEVLSQRPDLYTAQREVAAASADLGAAQAQRYPRLTLNGQVGTLNYSTLGSTTDLSTWSIGPVTLSLPILDGGRRSANVQAAQARYTEAEALYRAKVRQAVREVEDALLTLSSTEAQKEDAASAAAGYTASFNATHARLQAGSASLPELEDARRTLLAAQTNLLQLDLQRTQAWIALYRALGGGWTPGAGTQDAEVPDAALPQDTQRSEPTP